jgi:hypothetical protein
VKRTVPSRSLTATLAARCASAPIEPSRPVNLLSGEWYDHNQQGFRAVRALLGASQDGRSGRTVSQNYEGFPQCGRQHDRAG